MSFENQPKLARLSAVVLAGSLLLSACATGESTDPNYESSEGAKSENSNTFEETCVPANTRELPTSTSVGTARDTRTGSIYACEYLMDARVPFAAPTELYKVTNETYDSKEYQKQGSLGGWVFLGIGAVSGDVQESGKTERKRVSIIRFKDSDDAIQTAVLDTEKVRIKACSDDTCKPTVKFNVPTNPLWHKQSANNGLIQKWEADSSSIWYSAEGTQDTRTEVVKNLSLLSHADDSYPVYGGGPDKIGQIISSLSNNIVITLPPKSIQ